MHLGTKVQKTPEQNATMELTIFGLSILLLHAECAKILGVFPAPGYSQFILAQALLKELVTRGHQVVVISPYSPKEEIPNYRTIQTNEVVTKMQGNYKILAEAQTRLSSVDFAETSNFFDLEQSDVFSHTKVLYDYGSLLTELTMSNANVQAFLRSGENFDVVIVEEVVNEAMKGFAAYFGAPLVTFSSMGLNEWINVMGNPVLPSINAASFTNYRNEMTFFQRVNNVAATIFDYLYRKWIAIPVQKRLLNKFFPKQLDFYQVINNVSLMLLNSHVTTSENVLLPHNMIEIGGFHIVPGSLSKQVREYLDNAKDGAVFFSMGSNLKSSDLSNETLSVIFTVFKKLKQKVLWKFEKDFPNKPDNVFISKWFKQNDVLAHPNVKLFITHGGLLSITEAIYNGVPMIGIPIFADQKMNMARASHIGIAKILPFQELSLERLSTSIDEVLGDVRFRRNVQHFSKIIKDRPMKPLDLAIYWIEYVIRHKGARFEMPSANMYWFQIYMYDILAFVLINLAVLYAVIQYVLKLVLSIKSIKKKNQKKQE